MSENISKYALEKALEFGYNRPWDVLPIVYLYADLMATDENGERKYDLTDVLLRFRDNVKTFKKLSPKVGEEG